jgi:hypothetical protein
MLPGVNDEDGLFYDTDQVTNDVVESVEKEIYYVFPNRPQLEESED